MTLNLLLSIILGSGETQLRCGWGIGYKHDEKLNIIDDRRDTAYSLEIN